MYFRYSVDDTILILKELTFGKYNSIFEHFYFDFYKKLHEETGLKIQFNLFYECDGFNLSKMSDKFKEEFHENADWLQFSFHSKSNERWIYKDAPYEVVKEDCEKVHREIVRFASEKNLNHFTTIHFCDCTKDGVRALYDCGVRGLVGLFGTEEKVRISYNIGEALSRQMQKKSFHYDETQKMWYIRNDMVINAFPKEAIENELKSKLNQEFIEIMIHEQYFFKDTDYYDADSMEKVKTAAEYLVKNGYKSVYFDEILD